MYELDFEKEVQSLANNPAIQELFAKSDRQFQQNKGVSLSDVRKRFGLEKPLTLPDLKARGFLS